MGKKSVIGGVLFLIFGLFHSLGAQTKDEAFELSQSVFQAKGLNEAILRIHKYGYFSLSTSSEQGTAFQIVDRMLGPGAWQGVIGTRNGQQSILLEEGDYKIRMQSHEEGSGKLELRVSSFREKNTPEAPLMRDGQVVLSELKDLEQLSYWVEVKTNDEKPLFIEADGRCLADFVIWKDGNWYTGDRPFSEINNIVPEHPVQSMAFNHKLEPGLYKITAYGGEGRKWSANDSKNPIRIRFGVPQIPANTRFSDTISEFGRNRYVIQGEANYFLLQTEDKEDYTLSVSPWQSKSNPFSRSYSQTINKESRLPECVIQKSFYKDGWILVTVEGKPGKNFVFQVINKKTQYYLKPDDDGDYWVSTIHSGFIGDNIDAGGFLYQVGKDDVYYTDMPVLSRANGWQREVNILGTVSMYFNVKEQGNYEVEVTGIDASFRIERFLLGRSEGYKPPEYKTEKSAFPCEQGVHLLIIQPKTKGVATITVKKKALGSSVDKQDIQAGFKAPSVHLSHETNYRLYMNEQGPDVNFGMVVRRLPLDLNEALPVYLKPAEEITLPFETKEESLFAISTMSGGSFEWSLNGQPKSGNKDKLATGSYRLTLKNTGKKTDVFSLHTLPTALLPDSQPVYLSTAAKKSLPRFPVITDGQSQFFDLDSRSQKTFIMNMDNPGIAVLQSTGRLKTTATVRTRLIPSLFSAGQNGPGGNFLLQNYLRKGIYQVTVSTVDKSAGHLGLEVEYSDLIKGGQIAPENTVKEFMEPGQALEYRIIIPEDGEYVLKSIGMSKSYTCRLEDSEGWPLIRPGVSANLRQKFTKGTYRYIILPSEVEGRCITSLEQIVEKKVEKGKGPITLELNQGFNNTWEEKEKDGKRLNDVYLFNIPSPINVSISIDERMIGELLIQDNNKKWKEMLTIYPDKPLNQELEAGLYRLELHSKRKDNRFNYSIQVRTTELADGLKYSVYGVKNFIVSVKERSLVELFSKGFGDYSATLSDVNRNVLAYSDDAYNDWNFFISKELAPGKYDLLVESKGGSYNNEVFMRVMPEAKAYPIRLPFAKRLVLRGMKRYHTLAQRPVFINVDVQADSFAATAVSEKTKGEYYELFNKQGKKYEFDVFFPASGDYFLTFWSLDHIDEKIDVRIKELKFNTLSSAKVADYSEWSPVEGKILVKTEISEPATYIVECLSLATGEPVKDFSFGLMNDNNQPLLLQDAQRDTVSVNKGTLYLKWNYDSKVKIRLTKLKLEPGKEKGLGVTLNPQERYYFNWDMSPGQVSLLWVKGMKSIPLCGFIGAPESGSLILDGNTPVSAPLSLVERTAMTVSLSERDKTGVAWNPHSDGDDSVAITGKTYRLTSPVSLNSPEIGQLGQKDIQVFQMRPGRKTIEATLDENMAVFTWSGGKVGELYHSTMGSETYRFQTENEYIAVAAYDKTEGYYSLSVLASPSEPSTVTPILWESMGERESVLLKTKDTRRDKYVNLTGVENWWVLDNRGNLISGYGDARRELSGEQYFVYAQKNNGFSKAWISTGDSGEEERWGYSFTGSRVQVLDKPSLFSWGNSDSLWFKINLSSDSVINLSSDSAFVATVRRDEKYMKTREAVDRGALSLPLKAGTYYLGVRSIASGKMSSPAVKELSGSEDGIAINWTKTGKMTQTMGEETMIDFASGAGFRFKIDDKREVGIGYSSDSEGIYCELYKIDGSKVAEGPVIFTELEAEDYFVVYTLRRHTPAVKFIPIVVGLESIKEKVLADKVKEFLRKYGYLQRNEGE